MRLPAFLLALALATPAMAQTQPPGERLLLNPPDGWTPVQVQRTDKLLVTKLFQPGENEKTWTQSVTVMVDAVNNQPPRAFVESIIAYSRDNCEAVGPGPVSEAQINGYPMASVTITCTKGRASGLGSFLLAQAIRGRDGMYVVQRQWRGPAFGKNDSPAFPPNMLKDWGEFAKTVGLCDSRNPKHPCP
jgi:hypothetical protein